MKENELGLKGLLKDLAHPILQSFGAVCMAICAGVGVIYLNEYFSAYPHFLSLPLGLFIGTCAVVVMQGERHDKTEGLV